MSSGGQRWTIGDRYGDSVYLTQERWEHIVDPFNHPEMAACEEQLQQTIRTGRRQQDPLNPRKHRYVKEFDDVPEDNTHVVAITLGGFTEDRRGVLVPNRYIVTAYLIERR